MHRLRSLLYPTQGDCEQYLILSWVPSPQVAEQAAQSDQLFQPETKKKKKYVVILENFAFRTPKGHQQRLKERKKSSQRFVNGV